MSFVHYWLCVWKAQQALGRLITPPQGLGTVTEERAEELQLWLPTQEHASQQRGGGGASESLSPDEEPMMANVFLEREIQTFLFQAGQPLLPWMAPHP